MIILFVYCGIYAIMINPIFGRHFDEFYKITGGESHLEWFKEFARFNPLADWSYFFLKFLPYGYTSYAYYLQNSFFFVLFISLAFIFLKFNQSQKASHIYIKLFILLSLAFCANQMYEIFANLVYPERTLLVLIILFFIAMRKEQYLNNALVKTILFVFAAVVVITATYSKETAFAIFLVFALMNFLFIKTLDKREKIFNFFLILNALVFLALYYFFIFLKAENNYLQAAQEVRIRNILDIILIFYNNPALILVLIFTFVRLYFVLIKKDRNNIFSDSLLFSIAGYALTFILLGFTHNYYYSITIVLGLILLCPYILKFYDEKKFVIVWTILLFIFICSLAGMRQIKDDFLRRYDIGSTFVYNVLKVDMLTKYGREIVYTNEDIIFENYLYYVNSNKYDPKFLSLNEPENPNVFVRRIDTAQKPLYPKAVYISGANLPKENENFKDFVEIASWRGRHAFIHKDELK
ncbi:MAG: hypothetical protein LBC07_05525 [Elusimicrobiota bacterium]|nr:hypothetical protein [Elusimicrobiota bacterium]